MEDEQEVGRTGNGHNQGGHGSAGWPPLPSRVQSLLPSREGHIHMSYAEEGLGYGDGGNREGRGEGHEWTVLGFYPGS